MTKTKIKELSKGDHVRFASRWSQEEPHVAVVERIVTDMTHYRDVAYVKTWDGKQGVLTDNDSWVFVGGKVEDYFFEDKVSNKKQSKSNDVQQKKRFEHLKGNLSRMDRLHGVKLDELTPNDMRKLVGEKEEPNDIVNKPSHYTYGKIEVIDYCEQVCKEYPSELAPYVFNVIKYISRSELKNGKEDCEKAKFYLKRIIEKWDDAHE
ncbi:DUF3310 domain-containing protein [Staphylococcus shinii]|uniref:DUF3310 domain-containing protein n=1 Tax=Staphylococcus shinii TaxID=2912228 RepID=UPI000AD9C719|nr:DUF3310 domain-containing protein [Staphylococcus shinii]